MFCKNDYDITTLYNYNCKWITTPPLQLQPLHWNKYFVFVIAHPVFLIQLYKQGILKYIINIGCTFYIMLCQSTCSQTNYFTHLSLLFYWGFFFYRYYLQNNTCWYYNQYSIRYTTNNFRFDLSNVDLISLTKQSLNINFIRPNLKQIAKLKTV